MSFPSEKALKAVTDFDKTPITDESREIKRQFLADEISAYEFAELAGAYLKREESKIERVAKAIRKQAEYPIAHTHTDENFQREKPYWMDVARAAIAATK